MRLAGWLAGGLAGWLAEAQRGPERRSVDRTSLSCAWLEAPHKQIYDQGGSPLLRSPGDLASLYSWSIVSGSGVQLRCSMILEKASIRKFRESWTILNTERPTTYILGGNLGNHGQSRILRKPAFGKFRESMGIKDNPQISKAQTCSDNLRQGYAVVCCCLKHCLMPSGIWWLVFGIYIHSSTDASPTVGARA